MNSYERQVATLGAAMESGLSDAIEAHREELIGVFPPYVRPLLSLGWWAAKKMAVILAAAILPVLLRSIAAMTISQLIDFYTDNLKSQGYPAPR